MTAHLGNADYEYAVSACLCGVCCRYDGKTKCIPRIKKLCDEKRALPICPEVLGGMPTPRKPCEISGGRVINSDGEDMTEFFLKGANEALRICRLHNIKKVILKQNSPSCGSKQVYDGTFSCRLICGMGVTARLLSQNGIKIFCEDDNF